MKKAVLMLILMLSAGFAVGVWHVPMANSGAVTILIEKGDTLTNKARQWQRDGWLPSANLLKLQAKLLQREQVLRVGEYQLPVGLTGPQLLNFLATAKPVSYQLRFIEGTRLQDAIRVLQQAPHLEHDVEPLNSDTIATLIGIEGHPEGWLYPDTYIYHRGEKISTLIRQAHERMQTNLQQAWQQRRPGLPYSNPYEALVMASIVEKETGVPYERAEIAGVFVRRLQKNMRLETDPTVIYGLGDRYQGDLKKRHLRDRSNRHNTYRHKGLPPTPIAFAGRAALDAALNPADGETLYFVAKGDGSHYFSRTLEEHNKAVRKYQIYKRAKDYRSAPQ